ncbi:MAG: hypothetical protein AAFV53_25990 [Myxococcota bacterium]
MSRLRRLAVAGSLLVVPLWLMVEADGEAIGAFSFDQAGHIWTIWHATREPLTTTTLQAWPEGLDLLPALGGWADIVLGAALTPLFGLTTAYSLTVAVYILLAGIGGYALTRVLGGSPGAATLAGMILQLEPSLRTTIRDGQVEQVGIGVPALAVAGAIASWRQPGAGRAVATGLAGALTVFVSWEYGALLAGLMVLLAPGITATGRTPAAWRRWAIAAGTTMIVAGPWAVCFLLRVKGVRVADDEGMSLINATASAIALVDWFTYRPGLGAVMFAPLLALPWTMKADDRWIGGGMAASLILAAVLAMGPDPHLFGPRPRDAVARPWAPFTWLQALPAMGWYHWPSRIMIVWPVAGAVATGLLADAVGRRSRLAGVSAGALVLIAAGWTLRDPRARVGRYTPTAPIAVEALARLPGDGAVLDLPIEQNTPKLLQVQMLQLFHGRPLVLHSFPRHLYEQRAAARLAEDAAGQWLLAAQTSTALAPEPAALRGALARLGVRFVVMHPRAMLHQEAPRLQRQLTQRLGPPRLRHPQWIAWDLEGGAEPE